MSGRGGNAPLETDQVLLLVGASVGLSILIAKRHQVLSGLGEWLQERHLTVPGPAVLQLPYLGGLDGGRLLCLAGGLLVAVVVARVVFRLVRSSQQR